MIINKHGRSWASSVQLRLALQARDLVQVEKVEVKRLRNTPKSWLRKMVMAKWASSQRPVTTAPSVEMGDFRGIPTCACPACGSNLIQITAAFCPHTYELEMYLLDNACCAQCHALLTAPTPIDHPAAS
jgi:hypothetical protein